MDEIYLDYDPRNAILPMAQPGRTFVPYALPQRPPVAPRAIFGGLRAQPAAPAPAPVYYAPYYPPTYPPAPAARLGSKLSDLTVGDVVPLLAQLIIAFRPMPVPPPDEGRVETNLANMTKFLDAIARRFHGDQQLSAAGAVAGTFLR